MPKRAARAIDKKKLKIEFIPRSADKIRIYVLAFLESDFPMKFLVHMKYTFNNPKIAFFKNILVF